MANHTLSDQDRAILAKLAELGGTAFRDEDIVFEGDRIVIPRAMTLRQANEFIAKKIAAEEEMNVYTRTFPYRPWDGAYTTWNAFKKVFGMVGHNPTQGFFGAVPPKLITIPTGPGVTEQIPWGELEVPVLPGVAITLGSTQDDELGLIFEVTIAAPRKFRYQVEGLFKVIDEEFKTNSLYRGKAINGKEMPEFLDLSSVDPRKVVYSDEVMIQLEANVWTPLRHREALREAGIPRKRAALLHGPYGTGKSLAAALTAQVATENGWTFIQVRPGKDNLDAAMGAAKLYQPAVVFFEDIDTLADPSNTDGDQVSQLLDTFDGITAKGTEIVVVLTTNHPDKIHKGMVRPGRLDAVIEINALDRNGIANLVQVSVPEGSLEDDVDWESVAAAMDGFTPAYVKEAADRAFRYALSRNNGRLDDISLSTEDLVNAGQGLRPQLDLMNGAQEHSNPDNLTETIRKVVKEEAADVWQPGSRLREQLRPEFQNNGH